METIHRVGTFFILLGVGLIILFILSDLAKAPSCNFLIVGAVLLILGIVMWARNPINPGQKAERFRTVKKIMAKKPDQKSDIKKK
jgi:predicted membrane channel-forming protein YqfA (hemolysin III family)